ncbi:DUF1552 domain-containing protein [Bdellovibrio sp. HCB2-146]|uniref:DUF1552 domain-containing protein n=1 Tax=Bdellovibrio sp. HCB2-146 TaxID=3394362 RepID=UPI0039BD2647
MSKRNKMSSSNVDAVSLDLINRRMFIKTAVGYMAIPFLSSLIPRELLAQVAASPRRFIGIATSDQFPQQLLFPTGFVGKNNTAPYSTNTTAFQEGGFNFSETLLSSIVSQNGSISGALDSKFNSYVSRMVMLGGLDFPGRLDHGSQGCMGNTANSNLGSELSMNSNYTIDRVLARQSQIYSGATDTAPGMALRLGDKSCSGEKTGAGGRGQEVGTMELSLNGNLNQIFATYFKASTGSPGTTTTTGDATRKGIIDQIYNSAVSVRGSTKTSAQDKARLDEYLQNLSEVSKSLTPQTTTTPGSNSCPSVANDFTKIARSGSNDIATGSSAVANTSTYYKDVVRLITLFIKCDLCRVFNVGFASALASSTEAINFYTEPRPWHLDYGHTNNYPKLLGAQKWVLDNVVYELMKNLNTTESAETYLDNTLIYYSPEMSFGHSGINMGSLLIGDKRLNGGRALNFADYAKGFGSASSYGSYGNLKMELGAGQPINRLWVTMMQAYGIPTSAYFGKYGSRSDTFGNWVDYSGLGDFESPFKTVQRTQLIGSVLPKVLK